MTALGVYAGGQSLSMQYNYPATQNNGKIVSQQDAISGEVINYTYDAGWRARGPDNPSVAQSGPSYYLSRVRELYGSGRDQESAPSQITVGI